MLLVTYTSLILFFLNTTATTEIYTLSLHDALPISVSRPRSWVNSFGTSQLRIGMPSCIASSFSHGEAFISSKDRKSTRLNSSHSSISYAVFCLKKKNYDYSPVNISAREQYGYDLVS